MKRFDLSENADGGCEVFGYTLVKSQLCIFVMPLFINNNNGIAAETLVKTICCEMTCRRQPILPASSYCAGIGFAGGCAPAIKTQQA